MPSTALEITQLLRGRLVNRFTGPSDDDVSVSFNFKQWHSKFPQRTVCPSGKQRICLHSLVAVIVSPQHPFSNFSRVVGSILEFETD